MALNHMRYSLITCIASQVCERELFPVSMFKVDIDESQQSGLSENEKIELFQGGPEGER